MKPKNKVGRPRKPPYVAVKAYITVPNKAWLDSHGGATKALNALIEYAISVENSQYHNKAGGSEQELARAWESNLANQDNSDKNSHSDKSCHTDL